MRVRRQDCQENSNRREVTAYDQCRTACLSGIASIRVSTGLSTWAIIMYCEYKLLYLFERTTRVLLFFFFFGFVDEW